MYTKFLECGASLKGLRFLELEIEVKNNKSNGGDGIFKKAIGKIKVALGLKKKNKSST